jgi:hypothetical protein
MSQENIKQTRIFIYPRETEEKKPVSFSCVVVLEPDGVP